jgi:hypothetical protein
LGQNSPFLFGKKKAPTFFAEAFSQKASGKEKAFWPRRAQYASFGVKARAVFSQGLFQNAFF